MSQKQENELDIKENLKNVKNKIVVLSGKGGVGKSTISSNLAQFLLEKGKKVGILDSDIHGPSIPKILGVEEKKPGAHKKGVLPVETKDGLKIMSMAFLIPDKDAPVIWRGPMKMGALKQLLGGVLWGNLDYLIIDLPPGCISAGTSIYTKTSPKNVEDLKIGDYVFSFEGDITKSKSLHFDAELNLKKITDIIPQGHAKIYQLKTKTRSIKGTANHPILTLNRERKNYFNDYTLKWKKLAEIKKGEIIVIVKKLPDQKFKPMKLPKTKETWKTHLKIPDKTTDDFMRIVGYFIGDGFVRLDSKGRFWGVWFSEPKDGRYRKKYEQLLKKVFDKEYIYQNDQKFAIISKQMAELFDKLDLNHRALKKTIPDWVFSLPYQQKLAFIEGYCDADGYRRDEIKGQKRKGWMVFESPNKELIKKLRELCITVGIRVTNLNSRIKNIDLPSGAKWQGKSWTFESIKMENTRSNTYGSGLIRGNTLKGLQNEHVGFDRVTEIKSIEEEEVYDIQVEGNHNFVANGFIVHNTGDEPLSIAQLIPDITGVIIVTTPQDVALVSVRKSINFVKKMNLKILGIVENMSGFSCPHCGKKVDIFKTGGGKKAAEDFNIPYLGAIPLNPEIVEIGDSTEKIKIKDKNTVESYKLFVENVEKTIGGEK